MHTKTLGLPVLVSLLTGCQDYTVLQRASFFGGGNLTPGCEEGYSTMPGLDCCTTVQSAWATTPSEFDATMAVLTASAVEVSIATNVFDAEAVLVLWTDGCPGSGARLQMRSFDPRPDGVTVELTVHPRPTDEIEDIEGIRPALVLSTDVEHAGKPVQATARYP